VQRELEAAGFTTITLTPVPDLTASVSVPRVAAIEYPLGRTLGQPCDAAGQKAVLEATLRALETIQTLGNRPPAALGPKRLKKQNHVHVDPPIDATWRATPAAAGLFAYAGVGGISNAHPHLSAPLLSACWPSYYVSCFAILMPMAHRWAPAKLLASPLPGDELLTGRW
jgi:hypothetical protein